MKKIMTLALVILASASFSVASAQKKDKKSKKAEQAVKSLMTHDDSLSYAAGINATEGLIGYLQQSFKVDTAYMADFVRGFEDALKMGQTPQGTAYMAGTNIAKMVTERIFPGMEQMLGSVGKLKSDRFNEGFEAALKKDRSIFTETAAKTYQEDLLMGPGNRWLEANAKKPGVKVLPSGLQYKVLKEGKGAKPQASDEVEVVYEGRLTDGTVFDATANHQDAKSDKFRADQVIKGWTEALTMMPVGSKWEIYVPQDLAYGSRPSGKIPPYATLVFTIELLGISGK